MKSLLFAAVVVGAALSGACTDEDALFRWTMINVNYSGQQADAHILQLADGRNIMIDTGHYTTADQGLIPWLEQHEITNIDTIFITHPHKDHYGGLAAMMAHHIRLGHVYFNLPDQEVCNRERPWGCDYRDVVNMRERLVRYGAQVHEALPGLHFDLAPAVTLDILYAFDGVHTPVGSTDINDMSLVMMLRVHGKKILFTGDLNLKIGTWLAGNSEELEADLLKVPHHGTETTVPDIFFEKVNPKAGLVPAPRTLWESNRSRRIRQWFERKKIPVYVNGSAGDVEIAVDQAGLTISTSGQ